MKHASSSTQTKFKRVPSVGKEMNYVYWVCEGVLMINDLQKGRIINVEYYASNLRQLKETL